MTRKAMHSPTLAETAHVLRRLPPIGATPMRRLANALTAMAAALAMVLGMALPSRADEQSDNLLKAIAAIAAIALIANAIDKDDDDDRKAAPKPPPIHRPLLPAACAIQINGIKGPVYYGETCLRRHGFHHALPAHCARAVRIYGRTDRVYPEACLRKAGFHARRR